MTLFSFANLLRFRPRTGRPRHRRGNDLFLGDPSDAMRSDANSSAIAITTSKCNQGWPQKSVVP